MRNISQKNQVISCRTSNTSKNNQEGTPVGNREAKMDQCLEGMWNSLDTIRSKLKDVRSGAAREQRKAQQTVSYDRVLFHKMLEALIEIKDGIRGQKQKTQTDGEVKKKQEELILQPSTSSINRFNIPEARFKQIKFSVPYLDRNRRDQHAAEWLGMVVPQILSQGFSAMQAGDMDEIQTKIYCSEMMLLGILKLIQLNKLTVDEIITLNEKTLKDILEYNCEKYPQSLETEINKQISDLLVKRNDIQDPQNSLLYKSKVKFQLKPSGNYTSEIMKFLNQIIQLTKFKQYQPLHEDVADLLKLPYEVPNEESEISDSCANDKERMPIHKRFSKDIKALFDLVTDEEQVTRMLQFEIKKQNKQKTTKENRKKGRQLFRRWQSRTLSGQKEKGEQQGLDLQQMNKKLINLLESISSSKYENQKSEVEKIIDEKKKYKEEVEGYTSFKIGPKLSPNIQPFKKAKIENGDIKLNASLERILTKWVEELEKYFDEESILKREHPFYMSDGGQGYLKRQEFEMLNKILQEGKKSSGGPDQFLRQINRHNFQHQATYGVLQCPEQLKKYTVEEAIVGKFASIIHMNSETYIVQYLNCLIHTILAACQKFRKCLLIGHDGFKKLESYYQGKQFLEKIDERYNKIQKKEKGYYLNRDKTPYLISFRLGDLLRCRLTSKEKEITALYRQLQYISLNYPEFLQIVRVKDRLSKGNRDILINLNYRRTLLVQFQLGVKSQKTHFIEQSNAFSHYIYELKRPKFGPIAQLCSIWANKDPRAIYYKNFLYRINKAKIDQRKQFRDCEHKKKKICLPFSCSQCHFYYKYVIFEAYFCRQCNRKICFHCSSQENPHQYQNLFKIDSKEIIRMDQFIERFHQESKDDWRQYSLPKFNGIINLRSPQLGYRKVQVVKYRKKICLYQKRINHKGAEEIILVEDLDNKDKMLQFFLMENVFFLRKEKTEKDQVIEREIKIKYTLPKYFREAMRVEKRSLTLIGKQIIDSVLEKVQEMGKRYTNLKKLNLAQNKITSIRPLLQMELSQLQTLILSGNQIDLGEHHLYGRMEQLKTLKLGLGSKVSRIPEGLFDLKKLKVLELQNCKKIETIPDSIQRLEELTTLKLYDAESLVYLPENFAELYSLKILHIYGCKKLAELPLNFGKLISLQNLVLQECYELAFLPESFSQLSFLHTISFKDCHKLTHFHHNFFSKLSSLKNVFLVNLSSLVSLPQSFYSLKHLHQIDLRVSQEFNQLPESLGRLKSLKDLNLSHHLPYIPESIGVLGSLESLELINCENLVHLPESICELRRLHTIILHRCTKLQKLPDNIGKLLSLRSLKLQYCSSLGGLPETFSLLRSLQTFHLKQCSSIVKLPDDFDQLASLQLFKIELCPEIVSISENFGFLPSLQTLEFRNCPKLAQLPESFSELHSLQVLYLIGLGKLKKLPKNFHHLKQLNYILAWKTPYLDDLPENFGQLKSLETLRLTGLKLVEKMPPTFTSLCSLTILKLKNFPHLKQLPEEIGCLTALKKLIIQRTAIRKIPNSLAELQNLKTLILSLNSELETLPPRIIDLPLLDELSIIQFSPQIVEFVEANFNNFKAKNFYCPKKFKQKPSECCRCGKKLDYPFYWCRWSPNQNDYRCRECIEKKVSKQEGYYEYQNDSILIPHKDSLYFNRNEGKNIQIHNSGQLPKDFEFKCIGCKGTEFAVGNPRYICLACTLDKVDFCEKCLDLYLANDKQIVRRIQSSQPYHTQEHAYVRMLFNIQCPGSVEHLWR